MTEKASAPATIAAQELGWIELVTRAVVPPLHPSTTFVRDEDGGYSSGRIYARADSPAFDKAEAVLAELEGGAAAACSPRAPRPPAPCSWLSTPATT